MEWVLYKNGMVCTDRAIGFHSEWTDIKDCLKYKISPLIFKTRREAQEASKYINDKRYGNWDKCGVRKWGIIKENYKSDL